MGTLELIEEQIGNPEADFVVVSDGEIDALSAVDIERLQRKYGSSVLVQLPPREREFFEWLKKEDPDVWSDLWDEDEDLLVGLSYLSNLQAGGTGFPICELENNPNYFFTPKLITREGLEKVAIILEVAHQGKDLSVGEALLFEIMLAPVDIWHFCFKYGVSLQRGKETVHELYRKNILVHLTERADLVKYIEV